MINGADRDVELDLQTLSAGSEAGFLSEYKPVPFRSCAGEQWK